MQALNSELFVDSARTENELINSLGRDDILIVNNGGIKH